MAADPVDLSLQAFQVGDEGAWRAALALLTEDAVDRQLQRQREWPLGLPAITQGTQQIQRANPAMKDRSLGIIAVTGIAMGIAVEQLAVPTDGFQHPPSPRMTSTNSVGVLAENLIDLSQPRRKAARQEAVTAGKRIFHGLSAQRVAWMQSGAFAGAGFPRIASGLRNNRLAAGAIGRAGTRAHHLKRRRRASLCRLLGSSSSRRAALAQLPAHNSRACKILWRWQASTASRIEQAADTGASCSAGSSTAPGRRTELSRSSRSGSRVRICVRLAPRLSSLRAARLITCSSSRTLPGHA